MAHPGDHGGLGAFLHRDASGAGHGAAADRCGVGGHRPGEAFRGVGVGRMEAEESEDRLKEVVHILRLGPFPSAQVRLAFAGEGPGGAFRLEAGADQVDRCRRRPDAPGEDLASFCLGHRPEQL